MLFWIKGKKDTLNSTRNYAKIRNYLKNNNKYTLYLSHMFTVMNLNNPQDLSLNNLLVETVKHLLHKHHNPSPDTNYNTASTGITHRRHITAYYLQSIASTEQLFFMN